MNLGCPAHNAIKGMHEPRVEGTPISSRTFYSCSLCGEYLSERGPGLFYKEGRLNENRNF